MKHSNYSRIALLCLLAIPVGMASCASDEVLQPMENSDTSGIQAVPLGQGVWSSYRSIMSDAERREFDALEDAEARHSYLRYNGIDVRLALSERLSKGMSGESVRAALDGIYTNESHSGDENRLLFSAMNGRGRTHIYCFLGDEGLYSWGSYTDADRRHMERVNRLEMDLHQKLANVLEEGMGEAEIRGAHRTAKEAREDYLRTISDLRDNSKYGVKSDINGYAPSYNDYATEADALVLDSVVELYSVLDRTPNYIKREGNYEYWYHKIPVRGTETFIVLEYRFERRRLLSWHVYHTDFLGFAGM